MMLKNILVFYNILKKFLQELEYFLLAFLIATTFLFIFTILIYGIMIIEKFI